MRRYEQKFEVGLASATFLQEEIARHLPLYAYRPGFTQTWVTTVYYDTQDRAFYEQAERSYDDSLKIRVKEYSYRTGSAYISLPYCYVELKQRRAGAVLKRRVPVPRSEVARLLAGEDVWAEIASLNGGAERLVSRIPQVRESYTELRRYLTDYRVVPTSIVSYRRTVYQRREDELRITFDDQIAVYEIRPGLFERGESVTPAALTPAVLGHPVRRYDKVILEIKCPACQYPGWLETLLKTHFAKQLSKFTTSVRFLTGRYPEGADDARHDRDEGARSGSSVDAAPPDPDGSDDTAIVNRPIEG